MPAIIIGDVHGCLDELLELVQRCGGGAGTRVVLVGDLVAKGPDSAGVIQWARESGAESVLGNHDDKVLRLRPGSAAAPRDPKRVHAEVARSLHAPDWHWLAALPLLLPVGRRHLVVHAGLVPGVAVEEQERDHLLNLRSITPQGRPSKEIDGDPWASLWRGPQHVVFGHDAVRGLQRHPFATGLDTGCVYGGALTALVLPKGELVSVPARRAYATMK
jgi:Calcineurin-like phosphoesterase